MKASEGNQSFGQSNRTVSSTTPPFPAFAQLRRLLVTGSVAIGVVTASIASWGFQLELSQSLQLGVSSLATALLLTMVVLRLVRRRIRLPLSELASAMERVIDGHYDEHSMVKSEEFPQIGSSFNQLVTSFVLAKEAMNDRDLLQQIIDGVPDPLVVARPDFAFVSCVIRFLAR